MTSTAEAPQYGECCGTAMRKASRRLGQLYDNALQPCGLKSTQYSILSELARRARQPPTMQELANVLVMDRSTLGHNLRPLERDGLVTLRPGETDRRARHVVLTAEGQAKCRVARTLWRGAQQHFLEVFGHEEAAELRATLLSIAYDERLQR